jgi:IS1 family transposase
MYESSIFEGIRCISAVDVLMIGYYMLQKTSLSQTVSFMRLAKRTVWLWRRRLKCFLAIRHACSAFIGGPGSTVEVDETKMGRIKYGRGHRVKGLWVVVGVERLTRQLVATTVVRRNRRILSRWIEMFVRRGTVINTDCWKGYNSEDITRITGSVHRTVNHSVEYVTADGVHTNTVEGNNRFLKMNIPIQARSEKLLDVELMYLCWLRKNESSPWEAFLKELRWNNVVSVRNQLNAIIESMSSKVERSIFSVDVASVRNNDSVCEKSEMSIVNSSVGSDIDLSMLNLMKEKTGLEPTSMEDVEFKER